ncbi:L-threonylcarbamoyladenylate synthase [Microbacterium sp. M3]|uniref:L-threonylcarbamoyladenylate synthase n=1 Tax=Microbacterium arthrosphaerae TaxID=792652 RepID=A0ABU4H1L3_9MICO|nr:MULTISPECIES: L-threonylcarbamoyladenylate synthase [Microbacterium]MDW4573220.1 L-threonylcarbamoyladenylate synthase [Microbacterium arthrosphaerae]MDW7607075.1 L-threonylcarbamoyladenylate synthase [Microbacterium sp. M3]
MSPIFDCRDEAQLLAGMRQARQAIGRGELVVLPTDTVYGVAADAFDHQAVARLLAAKGRGRQSPPPVLVAGITTLRALVAEVPEPVERLIEAFWPGGLTIVLPAQPSLSWDLGETRGTVAVRMPAHRIALELLEETGPLAVSSANLTGMAAGITAEDAQGMLKDSVAVYLGDGPSKTGVPSTIIDATSLVGGDEPRVRVLREGAVSRAQLLGIVGDLLEPEPGADTDAPSAAPAGAAPEAEDAAGPEAQGAAGPEAEDAAGPATAEPGAQDAVEPAAPEPGRS